MDFDSTTALSMSPASSGSAASKSWKLKKWKQSFPPISFHNVACRGRLYLWRMILTHRWTGLWGGFPAGRPERKASGWTRLPPGERFGGKRTKWTKWAKGHICKMRSKENRTKRQCRWQDGYAFLPFEGRSWWVLGSECQWRHLVFGDNMAKFLIPQVSWGSGRW